MRNCKLILGTVQFGMKYGIANTSGKPSFSQILDILDFASKNTIDTLDTAYNYGDSETIIGKYITESKKSFKIISKFPVNNKTQPLIVERYCNKSLERLNQSSIYGYLVHGFNKKTMKKSFWCDMQNLKKQGLVSKIGISLYNSSELKYLLKNDVSLDIIQLPYNLFDQRFAETLPELKKRNVEIHARSIFLQGLFFLKIETIKKKFKLAKGMMGKLHKISIENEIPINALCLCFALNNPFIDKIVIGVDSVDQLKQNIDSINYFKKTKKNFDLLRTLKLHKEEIILPYNWK